MNMYFLEVNIIIIIIMYCCILIVVIIISCSSNNSSSSISDVPRWLKPKQQKRTSLADK